MQQRVSKSDPLNHRLLGTVGALLSWLLWGPNAVDRGSTERDRLEKQKLEAEIERLECQVRDLRKSWRPEYFPALILTIGGLLGGLILAWLAGFIELQSSGLQEEKRQLEESIQALKKDYVQVVMDQYVSRIARDGYSLEELDELPSNQNQTRATLAEMTAFAERLELTSDRPGTLSLSESDVQWILDNKELLAWEAELLLVCYKLAREVLLTRDLAFSETGVWSYWAERLYDLAEPIVSNQPDNRNE